MTAAPNTHPAATWTSPQVVSIGITGALAIASFLGMGIHITTHLDGKIDQVREDLNGKIDQVDRKIDEVRKELSGQIQNINGQIQHINTRIDSIILQQPSRQ